MNFRIVFMDCRPSVTDVLAGNYPVLPGWQAEGAMALLPRTLAWQQLAAHLGDNSPWLMAAPGAESMEYQAQAAEVRQWEETPDSPVFLYAGRYVVAFNGDAYHATILDIAADDDWTATVQQPAPRPTDLITQGEYAKGSGVSIAAIGQAIRDGRLEGYKNPNAPTRQGRTLISEAEAHRLWG